MARAKIFVLMMAAACGDSGHSNSGRAATISGSITGLMGSGLILKDNAGHQAAIAADGSFSFPMPLVGDYEVSVATQPTQPGQTCAVEGGHGTSTANSNITVTCKTNAFEVRGAVSGLAGHGMQLTDNLGQIIEVSADGTFAFDATHLSGNPFAVSIKTQPTGPSQSCSVSGGAGTVGNAEISSVLVNCATNHYALTGRVAGLLDTAILRNNGGDQITVSANGTFAFPTTMPSGGSYDATVYVQPSSPSQLCTIAHPTGRVTNADVELVMTCVRNSFAIGGSIAGLEGTGLVVQDNGTNNLAPSGTSFQFSQLVDSGATYAVTVLAQPTNPNQTCTVAGDHGTVGGADIASVALNCTTNGHMVGGTISGLAGTAVLQDNLGDDLTVSATDGTFSFSQPVTEGGAYSVTVRTQPTSPTQLCTVTNGTGTMATTDVSNVAIACTTTPFDVGGTLTNLAAGQTVVLHNASESLSLTQNGDFHFATQIASGASFSATVFSSPSSPISQTCTITGGSDVVGNSAYTGMVVDCATNSFTLTAKVTGMEAAAHGLVVTDGTQELTFDASGSQTFTTDVLSGTSYAVTVKTQPTGTTQVCSVTSGTATMASSNTVVTVSCADGTVLDFNGNALSLFYRVCGDGTGLDCTLAAAEQACTADGMKLISHASDGTSSVFSLGATSSCSYSTSYYTNNRSDVAGQCVIAISNAEWSDCCSLTYWHGEVYNVPTTLGQVFGHNDNSASGYNASFANEEQYSWGCLPTNTSPLPDGFQAGSGDVSACSSFYVACIAQ
ncbi:hypothetical protein BH11MYX1_BH11MYX1_01100 [soil metagenome]